MIFKISHKSKAILTDVLAHQAQLDGEKTSEFFENSREGPYFADFDSSPES